MHEERMRGLLQTAALVRDREIAVVKMAGQLKEKHDQGVEDQDRQRQAWEEEKRQWGEEKRQWEERAEERERALHNRYSTSHYNCGWAGGCSFDTATTITVSMPTTASVTDTAMIVPP
jgi:hypothetical protein